MTLLSEAMIKSDLIVSGETRISLMEKLVFIIGSW
jgi:hypothetical protein